MGEEQELGPEVIEAYHDLLEHIERSTGRIRVLSAVTIVVGLILAISYVYQLSLPFQGVHTVTVSLDDPANQAAEVVVLVLALAWLYIGTKDLMFSSRMKREIASARAKEKLIEQRASG